MTMHTKKLDGKQCLLKGKSEATSASVEGVKRKLNYPLTNFKTHLDRNPNAEAARALNFSCAP